MKKILLLVLLFNYLVSQSEDATLTIYKDGTALIKQPVGWSVPLGLSYITWNSLPNGIDRDTPFLNIRGVDILSQRFNNNIFKGNDFFNGLRGQLVQVKPKRSKLIKGTLLEISSNSITLDHSSGIISFNRSEIEFLGSKIENTDSPIFTPFLSWDLKSKSAQDVEGELVYKSNNFTWTTVYRLIMQNEEKGELIAEAVISNASDMSFETAKIQLVEGNLNKVKIKTPTPERMSRTFAVSKSEVPSLMSSDALGDYYIYSLNNEHDLGAKENITIRMYGPLDIGYTKKYVFENSERRQKEEPLEVQLSMNNTESNGLGISLPGGKVEMYSFKQGRGLEYIGADNMGQVPKGQSTTLTSGRAFDVIGNRKVLNYDRQRKSEEAVIEIRVTNARNEDVDVLLIEHINGDWVIKDESLNYQKKDASTIQFPLTLNAGETQSVYYTYRKEWK
ncbi:MAG: DUF4139 domain-containing protein [Fidelibacterota bacterium]|jgi:hypothetical protein|tara:strand:+ start:3207 stop:4550 length:1344 start_codon:yes stop_codon:yes gene_type:complete